MMFATTHFAYAEHGPHHARTSNTADPFHAENVLPTLHPQGRKWRFGYVGSSDYSEYPNSLRHIVNGLKHLGWLSVPEIPSSLNSEQLWAFLATHVQSEYIEFVTDAWWQPRSGKTEQRLAMRNAIKNRIAIHNDIDVMIAMGTWAGQDMAQLGAPLPTVVASTSDPVRSNIILSAEDSGLKNLHARTDPDRYQRQLELFHDIIPFKNLGIVLENSMDGRVYAGIDAVQHVAQEKDFSIQHCLTDVNDTSLTEVATHVVDCYRQLVPHIDAAYITVHKGITPSVLQDIVSLLRKNNIPSFSMLGAKEVRQGILFGLTPADESHLGLFYAETIARILNGDSPRRLSQIWIEPAKLAINLDTARAIGFDPPVDALLAADEIFTRTLE